MGRRGRPRIHPAASVELARLRLRAAERIADGSAVLLREAAGLTQAELGERLGTIQQAVSFWERGDRMPTARYLGAWMAQLDQWEARYGPALAATGTEGAAMA